MARYLTAVATLVLAAAVSAEDQSPPTDPAKIAEKLAGGLVHVDYTLQYDKGESPQRFRMIRPAYCSSTDRVTSLTPPSWVFHYCSPATPTAARWRFPWPTTATRPE